MSVQTQISAPDLERAQKLLAGIPGGAESAVRNAVSRAASHLRTVSSKTVRERYALPASAVRQNETVSVRYSFQNGAQAVISFAGHKLPLFRYHGTSPQSPGVRETVQAHQLTSTAPARFQHAFIARMRSGHISIFERTGGKTSANKDEISQIMGSSVPQMLGSQEVQAKLSAQTAAKLKERLDHEILRLLNGWGR